MLSAKIYSHGFNSVPANYKNHLTADYIKYSTSYGSAMEPKPADPLTPKPNIHYFLRGQGRLFHHPHLSWRSPSHPPTNTYGEGRRRRRRHHRRSRPRSDLFHNELYDLAPPSAMGPGGSRPPPSKYNHRSTNNIFQNRPSGYHRLRSSSSNYSNGKSLSTAKALRAKKTWYYSSSNV